MAYLQDSLAAPGIIKSMDFSQLYYYLDAYLVKETARYFLLFYFTFLGLTI